MCSRTGASAPMVEKEAHSSCMLRPPLRPAGRSGNGRRAGPKGSSSVRPPDQTSTLPSTPPPHAPYQNAHVASHGGGQWLGGGSATRWCERPFAERNPAVMQTAGGEAEGACSCRGACHCLCCHPAVPVLSTSRGPANKPAAMDRHSQANRPSLPFATLTPPSHHWNVFAHSSYLLSTALMLLRAALLVRSTGTHSLTGCCDEASAHSVARKLLFLLTSGLDIGQQTPRHLDNSHPLHQPRNSGSRLLSEHSSLCRLSKRRSYGWNPNSRAFHIAPANRCVSLTIILTSLLCHGDTAFGAKP
ncbi:hypothetical protein IF1G_01038 [Cordyceps javanica]|uniref:Uncharacterized protein n=1 Tax=Cordyceps javanica TaxID=43265 RepID=A0A545VHA1_9HYPO|nr:hypothetical protein IF1G_01038 [Cordyceps javanica]